jgi:hypothetical protein
MAYVLTAKWTARDDQLPAAEAALRRLIYVIWESA